MGVDMFTGIAYEEISMVFEDRADAGMRLAGKLKKYKGKDAAVVALPRGGVPVGFEIAKALQLPLDILIVRKIGSPFNPEYGIGAIAEGNVLYVDEDAVERFDITRKQINEIARKEKEELERRRDVYRRDRKPLPLRNKIVILADDGLATGVTAIAGILAIRKQQPKKLILAVPGCPAELVKPMESLVDEFICLSFEEDFSAVGQLYHNFAQVSDEEVITFILPGSRDSDSQR